MSSRRSKRPGPDGLYEQPDDGQVREADEQPRIRIPGWERANDQAEDDDDTKPRKAS